MPNFPAAPETGALLRLPQVLALYPVSRSSWWAGVRAGRYPQPVKLGTRCIAWHSADIAALIESTRKPGATANTLQRESEPQPMRPAVPRKPGMAVRS